MFFHDWTDVLRVVLVGIPAYAGVVLFLRATGNRTLSKMNAFDLVVTVALGSTLASTLTSSSVALVEGLAALLLLILLQYAITWMSVRSPAFNRVIKAEPAMLFFRGTFLYASMKRERVTRDEVLAAIRDAGILSLSGVEAVVLGSSGDLAVVPRAAGDAPIGGDETSLADLDKHNVHA